jgi:hypothetical protein
VPVEGVYLHVFLEGEKTADIDGGVAELPYWV